VSAGPLDARASRFAQLRPLPADSVRFEHTSRLGAWQDVTHAATVPHVVEQVERCGAVENLRQVRDGGTEPFQGLWFADSDVYKVLEAVAWDAGRTGETEPSAFWTDTVELLAAAQRDDGYLNSWFQRVHPEKQWQDLGRGHEMYCAGHLIQAGIAASRALGRTELLAVARRFADHIVRRFGPNGDEGLCGHPEIETALVELYRETGERSYLDTAAAMIDRRGRGLLGDDEFGPQYFQDHVPVREAQEVTGHAVRQLYLAAGATDVYLETGDPTLLAAMERLWDSAYGAKTYITGGQGSRHRDEAFGDDYELPPDRAYAETCAAIAAFQWNWRLLLSTGSARYADAMEWTLHNAIAASTTADGTGFFYSNPLQLRSGHDGSQEDAPSERLPWYRVPCCPPNLARLISTVHDYAVTTSEDGLQLHLYGAGSYRADLPAGSVALHVDTDLPWDGHVRVLVEEAPATPVALALRIPAWAEGASVTVDGETRPAGTADGYLRLDRVWQVGDVVELDLPMPVRFVRAHPGVDAVRGAIAAVRGPLVYTLEQAGQVDGVDVERVRVCVRRDVEPQLVDEPSLPDVPVAIRVDGELLHPASGLYRTGSEDAGEPVALTLVPFFRWGNRGPGAMRVWLPELVR
jgi:DUF1680 family protein